MAEKFLPNGEYDIADYVLKRLERVLKDAYSGIPFDHTLDNVPDEELAIRIRNAVDQFWINTANYDSHKIGVQTSRKEHLEAIAELNAWHDAEVAAGRLKDLPYNKKED